MCQVSILAGALAAECRADYGAQDTSGCQWFTLSFSADSAQVNTRVLVVDLRLTTIDEQPGGQSSVDTIFAARPIQGGLPFIGSNSHTHNDGTLGLRICKRV